MPSVIVQYMRFRSLLLVVLVATAATTPALAQTTGTVSGSPTLSLSVQDNHFTASQKKSLDLTIMNDGSLLRGGPEQYEQEIKTARNVKMNIDSVELRDRYGAQIQVKSGEVSVGSVPEGSVGPFSFQLEIGDKIAPGTYKIPIELDYDYTNYIEYSNTESPTYHENSRSISEDVTIIVEDRPRFDVDIESEQPIVAGDSSSRQISITNVGTDTANSTELKLTSGNPTVFFGGVKAESDSDDPKTHTSSFVGDVSPGESKTVSVKIGANSETVPGVYPMSSQLVYENENGITERSATKNLGVNIGPEQTFDVENLESTLRVDDDGEVRGTLTNTGPEAVSNVVLNYQKQKSNLYPRESEYAMNTLESGESKSFNFRIDVSSEAEEGPRQISYIVQYRNSDNDLRKSDPIDASVAVASEVDEFNLKAVNSIVTAGSSETISVNVTNIAEQSLTDIEAKMFTDDPLSSADDTAYIDQLDPGESTMVKFDVAAAESAIVKEYPVSIDFSYDDERGETELSDTYRLGVVIEEPEEQGPPMAPIVGFLVVVLGLVAWWQRDLITSRLG